MNNVSQNEVIETISTREIAWDVVTHIRENNLPTEGAHLVNYMEQAIERGIGNWQRARQPEIVNGAVIRELEAIYLWIKRGEYIRDDAPDEICRAIKNRVRQLNGSKTC